LKSGYKLGYGQVMQLMYKQGLSNDIQN
jgi:hypothetical protein